VQVNPSLHTADQVGDEPLLLAQILPTWVCKDKITGAQAAIAAGAQLIIMDDGFQNQQLHKDVSLLVIDGHYGLGNERIIPAGPLREPIAQAMARASAVVIMGDDLHHVASHIPASTPLLKARLVPGPAALELKDKSLVAFAGIAHPRKFYRTLQELGGDIKKMVAYPDHYVFKASDIAALRNIAKEHEAMLVTTFKDFVRLPASIRAEVIPVPVDAVFEDMNALLKIIVP
jgi:tetraacyldisaccharide 4'-kinase